jgi:hypothetical protein
VDSDLAVIGLTGIGPIRKISVLDWSSVVVVVGSSVVVVVSATVVVVVGFSVVVEAEDMLNLN